MASLVSGIAFGAGLFVGLTAVMVMGVILIAVIEYLTTRM